MTIIFIQFTALIVKSRKVTVNVFNDDDDDYEDDEDDSSDKNLVSVCWGKRATGGE